MSEPIYFNKEFKQQWRYAFEQARADRERYFNWIKDEIKIAVDLINRYDKIYVLGGLGARLLQASPNLYNQFMETYSGPDKEQADEEKIVDESENPLVTALKFSIAGNIIDYGALADFDVKKTLGESLNKPFGIWHFKKFYNALEHAENIIYLGDNAGEIVFDRLLIETIAKRVTFVVRGGPIINDVLMEDAKMVGITDLADVVSNSVAVPGTIVQEWPEELRKKFYNADLIISKGQGNFESLSETDGNIFFLFMIKCDMVARHGGQVFRTNEKLRVGDFILGSRQ